MKPQHKEFDMTCANADVPASQLFQEAAEAAVLCLINEQRAANGVSALALNLKLLCCCASASLVMPEFSNGGLVAAPRFT